MRPHEAANVFDAVATDYSKYDEAPVAQRIMRLIAEDLAQSLEPGARVADVGCGPGTLALRVSSLGFEVTALDVSEGMLEVVNARAGELGQKVRTANHDIGLGPVPDGPYHGVIATMGPLNYTEAPGVAMSNLRASVEVGGFAWLALARAASFPRVLRHPRPVLEPLLRARANRIEGSVQGRRLDLFVWDPRQFLRCFGGGWQLVQLRGLGLSPRLPAEFNERLETKPVLRRLGSVSLLKLRAV